MKRILPFLIPLAMLVACGGEGTAPEGEEDPIVTQLREENEKLLAEKQASEENIEEIASYFNEIEANLKEVKEREGLVTVQIGDETEMDEDRKQQVIDDIQAINTLLLENKNKIGMLQKKLDEANFNISEFQKMVENLTLELEAKNVEIEGLREELAELKFNMKLLTMANMEQEEMIEMQESELNTAFYCFGTFKELKENGVVTKEGGFIGIGRSEKLTDDFNKKYFTQLDVTETKEVDVYSKKARLVTTHPEGSYEWKGSDDKVDQLIIKDEGKFWSVSKYLVIIVD